MREWPIYLRPGARECEHNTSARVHTNFAYVFLLPAARAPPPADFEIKLEKGQAAEAKFKRWNFIKQV